MWTPADFNQSRWAQSPGKGLKGKDRHMWLKAKGPGPVLPEIVQFSGLGSCPLPLTFCSPWTLASLCSSVGEKVPVCLRPTGPAKILEVLGSQLVWPEALGRQPSCGGHSGGDGMLAIEGWAGRSCWVGHPRGGIARAEPQTWELPGGHLVAQAAVDKEEGWDARTDCWPI